MKNRNVAELTKNAMGTVFLLAGAFFVCSTFLSIRAVFADPIAPMNVGTGVAVPQAQRAGNASPRTTAASPRASTTTTVSRGTTAVATTSPSRAVAARTMVSRGTTAAAPATSGTVVSSARPSMASSGRTVVSRGVTSRGTATSGANTARTVVARTATTGATSAANTARVSLQGSAIRGSKLSSNTYTYLSSKLYTGNYSNIIDSTTGLISADAYSNCVESYYACMDEICTARNASQGRCACAGRVKSFAEAEAALESANEELIEVSGQLALLIATKGKDVSAAFQLTDAEKIMNCASYAEAKASGETEVKEWCKSHKEYTSSGTVQECGSDKEPTYCTDMGDMYGFELSDLTGSSSDILAKLKSWADAKDDAAKMLIEDNDSLLGSLEGVSEIVSGLVSSTGGLYSTSENNSLDKLANTWGYDLFEYAHNNVCSRVLDSCFNGIYEACGTPPNGGKCADGKTSSCPYNYNSKITVENGQVKLSERGSTGSSATTSATCFGYTSTTGDPYSDLRGPVADARRSVMQKYLLDANAACDVYGDQLTATAQNIGYQKVAAQQALQQKRLEFAQEEQASIASNYSSARNNFNECLSELYDCYTTQETANPSWSTSRIKTYCAQVSNVPHCYDTMICGASNPSLQAVIDVPDIENCDNNNEYSKNTCRNIVTLSEILSGSYAQSATGEACTGEGENCGSIKMREQCLQNIGIEGVRNWARSSSDANTGWSATACTAGQHLEGNSCLPDTKTCVHKDLNAATAQMTWSSTTQSWSGCQITSCKSGYTLTDGACVAN